MDTDQEIITLDQEKMMVAWSEMVIVEMAKNRLKKHLVKFT